MQETNLCRLSDSADADADADDRRCMAFLTSSVALPLFAENMHLRYSL
jgi:hypothetical protein